MIHWFRVIFSSYNRWFCEATFTYTHWMPRCAWGSRIPETFINTAIQQDNCTLSLVPCFENNSVANHLQKGSYIEPTLLLLPVHVVVHVIKEGLYCWLILDPWSWLQTYRILNLESWILNLDPWSWLQTYATCRPGYSQNIPIASIWSWVLLTSLAPCRRRH